MKKNNAFLLFMISAISFSLSTKVTVKKGKTIEVRDVLTADMSKKKTGKVVKCVNTDTANNISTPKAQISENIDGTRHIRFVVGIDSISYTDVKFDIIAKDEGDVVKSFLNKPVTTAYTHIEASGKLLTASDVFGEDYNYLIAYTVNNVPENAWHYNFEVTASVKTDESQEWINSDTSIKCINDIIEIENNKDKKVNVVSNIEGSCVFEGKVEQIINKNNPVYEDVKIVPNLGYSFTAYSI